MKKINLVDFGLEGNGSIYINQSLSSLREKCPNTEFFLVRIWALFIQWLLLKNIVIMNEKATQYGKNLQLVCVFWYNKNKNS